MSERRVLVTGATGTVGGTVVAELLGRGVPVRGATRDPGRARARGPDGAEWIYLDLDRPDSFGPALDGVDRVFLIARPGDDDPAGAAAPLVEAMRGRGVVRVVTLTAMGVEERDDVSLGRVERLVEEAGLSWTHLRPNWFMQVFSGGPLLDGIRSAGRIEVPAGSAAVSWVDARDVAAVAAAALTESGHEGRAWVLTGPRALDHTAVARVLADALARAIAYRPLDEEEARRAMVAAGLGARWAQRLLRFYRLVREGECARVSSDVERVLGRPPRSFERFARDHRACWEAA